MLAVAAFYHTPLVNAWKIFLGTEPSTAVIWYIQKSWDVPVVNKQMAEVAAK